MEEDDSNNIVQDNGTNQSIQDLSAQSDDQNGDSK